MQTTAFASSGDPNIDNGGGNLLDGSSSNFWNPGNDRVRVTVVDAESGEVKSASVDYTNSNVRDIIFHFGKKCKAEYVSGAELSASNSGYTYIIPNQHIPTIISDGMRDEVAINAFINGFKLGVNLAAESRYSEDN